MSVIPLTIAISLGLVLIFVFLFWSEQRGRSFGGSERDSLLPLADEAARPVVTDDSAAGATRTKRDSDKPGHSQDADDGQDGSHAHTDGLCGCRSGLRPPCTGCLRLRNAAGDR